MDYSKNEFAEKVVGLRRQNVIAIDEPYELGYHCPVCVYELITDGNYDERLMWSEYNSFLWCLVCNRDYPSALCMPDYERATEVFLRSITTCVERIEIERDAWKREALAAREFIVFLEQQFSWDGETVEEYDVYYDARVPDEKEQET